MSYTKDKDAHTRGVGAIAAVDGGRLRARRKVMQARALRSRDNALSTWTMGPSGGHPGLGAISQVGMNLRNPVLYGRPGSIDVPGSGLLTNQPLPGHTGGGGAKPPTVTISPVGPNARRDALMNDRKVATVLFPTGVPPRGGKGSGSGADTSTPPQYKCWDGSFVTTADLCSIDPSTISQPMPTTDPSTGPATGSSSGSGGAVTGGGGGGIMSGGSSPAPTFDPVPGAPDLPDEKAPMSNTTKVVLAAAALGGLYLLFGKKKKEGQ